MINGKEFSNVSVPQNFDIGVDEQERTRTSGTAVIQYAPNDELTLTFDGLVSKFEVDSQATNAGHWFSEGNFIDAEVDDKANLSNAKPAKMYSNSVHGKVVEEGG